MVSIEKKNQITKKRLTDATTLLERNDSSAKYKQKKNTFKHYILFKMEKLC